MVQLILFIMVQNGVYYNMAYNDNPSYLKLVGGTMTGILTLNGDPVGANDAANKSYVDAISAGLTFKTACVCATTVNLNATYLNVAAGVGATLINAGALAAFTVDGITPTINQRVLVKNQTTTFQNGIYTITTLGTGAVAWILTRATDYDQPAEINPGDIVPVTTGSTQANTAWLQTSFITTIGTDAITFQQYQSTPIQTTQYDVLVGGASNTVVSVGPGSAGQILQSGGNAANPAYSTSTYPTTNAVNTLLYASSANVMAALATANNGVLITSSGGIPSILANGTTGQFLTATASSPPSWTTPAVTLLSKQTASSSASIIFTGLSSTYSYYELVMSKVIAGTNATTLTLQFSTDNGSTYLNSGYQGATNTVVWNGTTNINTNSTTYSPLCDGSNFSNVNPYNGSIKIYGMGVSTFPQINGLFTQDGNQGGTIIGGYNSAAVANALQIISTSGTIASGTFSLYGVM